MLKINIHFINIRVKAFGSTFYFISFPSSRRRVVMP